MQWIQVISFYYFHGSIFHLETSLDSNNPCFEQLEDTLTGFRTEGRIHQASLLVNAGHGLVAHTLAALLNLPMPGPTFWWAGSWRVREDASGPVATGLGEKLIAGTRLCLLQRVRVLVQAEVLLLTATWEWGGKLLALANAPSANVVAARPRKISWKCPKQHFTSLCLGCSSAFGPYFAANNRKPAQGSVALVIIITADFINAHLGLIALASEIWAKVSFLLWLPCLTLLLSVWALFPLEEADVN